MIKKVYLIYINDKTRIDKSIPRIFRREIEVRKKMNEKNPDKCHRNKNHN